MTRAKFTCYSKTETFANYYDTQTGVSSPSVSVSVAFTPVTGGSDENKEFYKNTPSGKIELGGLRKEVADRFELNKEYYVDFSAA